MAQTFLNGVAVIGDLTKDGFVVFDRNNALGTVSQSGGEITGSLFQADDDANGYFEMRASGVMECWHTIVTSASAAVTWTYPTPVAFVMPPSVGGTAISGNSANVNIAALRLTSADFVSYNVAGGLGSKTVCVRAIGRWF